MDQHPAFWAAVEGKRTAHFWRYLRDYAIGYWSNCGQDGRAVAFQPVGELPRCKTCAKHGDPNAPTNPSQAPPRDASPADVAPAHPMNARDFPLPPQIGPPRIATQASSVLGHNTGAWTTACGAGAWATVHGDPFAHLLQPHDSGWQALCNAHRGIVAPRPRGPTSPCCPTCARAAAVIETTGSEDGTAVMTNPSSEDTRVAQWGNKTTSTLQHWFAPVEHGWRSACTQVTTASAQLLHCPEQPRCARCTTALERVPPPPDPGIAAPAGFCWEYHGERWVLCHANGYHTGAYHTPERAVAEAKRWLASQPQPHVSHPSDFPSGTAYWEDGWRLIRDADTGRWSVRHASGLATEPSTNRRATLKRLPELAAARRALVGWQVTFEIGECGWRAARQTTTITAPDVLALAALARDCKASHAAYCGVE